MVLRIKATKEDETLVSLELSLKDNTVGLFDDNTGKPISQKRRLLEDDKAYPIISCPNKSILPINTVFIENSPLYASNFCHPVITDFSLNYKDFPLCFE